jgi:hypothetical protein
MEQIQTNEPKEDTQRTLMMELRKGYLSMVATIERTYGLRRAVRCPRCGHRYDASPE